MAGRKVLSVLLLCMVNACYGQTDTPVCHDIDSTACELLIKQNPNLCSDEILSASVCPRFCKICPLTCFHCDNLVMDYADCNVTRSCPQGDRCMIRELSSTLDGHHEYMMTCASIQMCDGNGLTIPFGRRDLQTRDISARCCSDDLCNNPNLLTTTTTTTTTTTMSSAAPTTVSQCSRDIMLLIEDKTLRQQSETVELVNFVKGMISDLAIGVHDNLVGLTLYDTGTHDKIHFGSHTDKPSLLHAIDNIGFKDGARVVDYNDVVKFLQSKLTDPLHGDRPQFDDVVIIFVDQYAQLDSHAGIHTHNHHIPSRDVVLVDIGYSSAMTAFSSLATDSSHVLHVPDFSSLSSIKHALLNLICL